MLEKLNYGPFLVMAAAALWALDALIRVDILATIPPASIVFFEHLIGFIILAPFFFKSFDQYRKLEKKDWGLLFLLTIVSSVAGTLLFTAALAKSFALFDFATPILVQKLQPIFVIVLASLVLREKVTLRFLGLVLVALIGSYMISFGTEALDLTFGDREMVYLLALGAAAAWGTGTVISKSVLNKLTFSAATSMRFLLAIPVAIIVALTLGQTYPIMELSGGNLLRFIIIGFTTGAASVLLYYKGLQMTKATVATMAEITFPIVSILIAITALNPYGEPQVLSLANIFGIIILITSILIISRDYGAVEKSG